MSFDAVGYWLHSSRVMLGFCLAILDPECSRVIARGGLINLVGVYTALRNAYAFA
jgi:hypothetical protein